MINYYDLSLIDQYLQHDLSVIDFYIDGLFHILQYLIIRVIVMDDHLRNSN